MLNPSVIQYNIAMNDINHFYISTDWDRLNSFCLFLDIHSYSRVFQQRKNDAKVKEFSRIQTKMIKYESEIINIMLVYYLQQTLTITQKIE